MVTGPTDALDKAIREAAIDRLADAHCAARELRDLHRRLFNLGARGKVLDGMRMAEWYAWREADRTRSHLFGTPRTVDDNPDPALGADTEVSKALRALLDAPDLNEDTIDAKTVQMIARARAALAREVR